MCCGVICNVMLCYVMCVLQAAIGIASLLVMAMEQEGTSRKDALNNVWMVDSKGLIVVVRVYIIYLVVPIHI